MPPQAAPEASKATADTGGADSEKPFKSDAVAGLHTFYYAWYGNPALDGKWVHWNHQVLKHWAGAAVNSKYANIGTKHTPPETIGSNFYPTLGPYSSRNASVVDEHVRMMAQAGIGVLVYSWWGRGLADENGDPTDEKVVALVGQACLRNHIQFTFHLEPYENRNALSVKEDVKYLISKYRTHPAFYKLNHKAVFYVYDSYRTSKEEWQSVLGPFSALNPHSIRGTDHDCSVLGLWVDGSHGEDLKYGGFDGFYTYFATDGMTYGSSHSNWDTMRAFAASNKMIFVPSIGPGYIDTAIRPWNSENTRNRESGEYYARSWRHALSQSPDIISITSFNEWHEGTQILLFQRVVLVH
jgi:glycoprotein endo-alpha-1,2-mannosidase